MAGQIAEGTIADGPNGATLIYTGGVWMPMQQQAAPMVIGTPDVSKQQLQQLEIEAKKLALEQARSPKSAPPSGYRFKANGDLEAIPGGPVVGPNGVKKSNGVLDAIVTQINDVSSMFGRGIGGNQNPLVDYLPTPDNRAFDAAAAGLEDQATMAFKVPGAGGVSDQDAARIARANKPNRFDYDEANRQRLHQLRVRVDAAREAQGLPAAKWVSDEGTKAGQIAAALPQQEGRSIARGSSRVERDPAASAALDRMIRAGMTPDEINASLRGMGQNSADPAQIVAAQAYLKKNPGYKGSFGNVTREVPVTGLQRAAASPVGALFANAGNAVTADNLDSIAGAFGANPADVRTALDLGAADNPDAALTGNLVGGTVAALGGEGLAGRLGLNGIRAARAGDLLYGAASGAGSADDGNRLTGALLGGGAGLAGGVAGRRIAGALGTGLRGVTVPNVTFLSRRGVPMTLGQMTGGFVKGIEDRLSGIPIVGDAINARRRDGVRALNRVAFDEALAPIGLNTNGVIGAQGVEAAQDAVGRGFDTALNGRSITPDAQGRGEWNAAYRRGASTPTYGRDFRTLYADDINPIAGTGQPIDGRQFQDLDRTLGGYQRQYRQIANGSAFTPPAPVARRVSEAFGGLLIRKTK